MNIFQEHNRIKDALCLAVLQLKLQSVFPDDLVTSRNEWDRALELWGIDSEKWNFEDCVDNCFARKQI